MKFTAFQLKIIFLGAVFFAGAVNTGFAQTNDEIAPKAVVFQTFQPKNCKFRALRSRIKVVRNNEELQDLTATAVCPKTGTENVDFTKFTLIGITFFVAGCETAGIFKTEVWRDDKKKSLLIKIISEKTVKCRSRDLRELWILTPKLPADFTTEFDRNEKSGETADPTKNMANHEHFF